MVFLGTLLFGFICAVLICISDGADGELTAGKAFTYFFVLVFFFGVAGIVAQVLWNIVWNNASRRLPPME